VSPACESRYRLYLAAYLRSSSQKEAAASLGIRLQTLKNGLGELYAAMGVRGHLEAAIALGWVSVPQEYAA
jgi:hypothetical protein